MTILSSFPHYRTRPLTLDVASRFARCLAGNAQFTGVEIVEAPRSPGKYVVRYLPANPERAQAIRDREQDSRAARAASEGDGYTFCLDESRRFFWCLSVSGEVYEVSERSCSCPDHQFRCGPNGMRCKHQLALAEGRGTVASF